MLFQDYYGPYEFTTALRTEPIKEEIEDDEDPVQISHEEEPKKKVAKVKRKISGGSAVYPCRYCPLVLPKENRRVAHESQHTGEKAFKCDVEGCDKAYAYKPHLKRHKRSRHETKTEIASVDCKNPNCHQKFTTKSNMNRHYQTIHMNPTPHACRQCDERFRRKIQLKKHEILKHTSEYPYRCPTCNKGFLNLAMLTRHLPSHNEEKPKTCPDCNDIFPKWSLLVEHRRRWHKPEWRLVCDHCDRTFCRKSNLRSHMKVHLTSLTEEVFQCHYENCPKFYNVNRNLQAHIRSKHEGQTFVCNICSRRLSTKQKLKQHLNAHLDPARAKLLVKKSRASQLAGVNLPQSMENKILQGEGSQVKIDAFEPLESTHETSATEQSDF